MCQVLYRFVLTVMAHTSWQCCWTVRWHTKQYYEYVCSLATLFRYRLVFCVADPLFMWKHNPLYWTMGWHDVAICTMLTLLGTAAFERSLLIRGRAISSWCSGLGSKDIILSNFILPALGRAGYKSTLKVVWSCDWHLELFRTSRSFLSCWSHRHCKLTC